MESSSSGGLRNDLDSIHSTSSANRDYSESEDRMIHRRRHSETDHKGGQQNDILGVEGHVQVDFRNSSDSISLLYEDANGLPRSENRLQKIKEPERSSDGEEEPVPDGGWGWVVVFGASLIVVLVDTMGQCFGILFSRFLLELNTSTVVTAWIFNLYQFLYNMTGPVLGPLIQEFGWRTLTVISSFILAVGTITSAFVKSAYVLFLTYSLFVGVGSGVLSNISYLIVPYYFKKRRGLANGIIMAWDCGGQFIGAPLIRILQDEYSFTGATLILGGIILNCCVGAAVFHPVHWHVKRQVSKSPREEEEEPQRSSENQKLVHEQDHGKDNAPKGPWQVTLQLIRSTAADLCILKSATAVIIAVTTTVTFNGYLNFLALVPFAMQETGYTLGDAATCVSLSAICNITMRVVVAALSDTKFFNYRLTMLVSSLAISGAMLGFTLLKDLNWIKVAMATWGCGVGTYNGIFNLVMIHYMGLDNFMPMFGASLFITGFGYLAVGPLAGYIRDVTGSYAICIQVLAGVSFCSFPLWLLMPAAVAHDLRRERKKGSQAEDPLRI